MDFNVDLLQWFINFLVKKLLVVVLKIKIFLTESQRKNYTNYLLENLTKEKYIHLFLTIFAVQI